MAKKKAKFQPASHRIHGTNTPERAKELRELRKQLDAKKPEIIVEAKEMLAEANERRAKLSKAFAELRKERENRGVTLDELAKKSGIAQEALSRLETGVSANPTINTIERYAHALGLDVQLAFVARESGV